MRHLGAAASFWVGFAVLINRGVLASGSDLGSCAASSSKQALDELQLLQLKSEVAPGKDRAADLPDDNPNPQLPEEIFPRKDPYEDNSKDFLSGFTRLFVSPFALKRTKSQPKASKSASPRDFGFNGMYCERRHGGPLNHHDEDGNHGPEILNTVTAAFIFFVGMYQLVLWNHQSAFIRLLCALVVINGWSSALRHMADIPFCAVLDGTSMVLGAVLGCCFMVDLAAQRARNFVTTAVLRMAVWAGMPVLFCLCFMRNPHSFDPHTQSMAFRVMFALPVLCVIVAVYGSLWCNWVTWTSIDDEAIDSVKYYLRVGVPLFFLGVLSLGLSELFCETSSVAQYFPGHALWHLLFPFGVNALLLFICTLWSDTKLQPMSFNKGTGWQARWYAMAPAFSSGPRVH